MANFLEKLNPRERRLALILGGVMAFLVLVAIPATLESLVLSRRSETDDLRSALGAVQAARAQVRERQSKKDLIAHRYGKKAPVLAGYLEQTARSQKLEVTDSVDRPEVPHGKRYSERSTQIHLKKAGMYPIAKFIEALEKSGYPLAVTRLSVRKRSGEPDSYDVEIGVSAYDRAETAAAPPVDDAKDKDAKEKDAKDGKDKKGGGP
jgi:general secretion pathway protein M